MPTERFTLSLIADSGSTPAPESYEVLERLGQGGMGVVYRACPVGRNKGMHVALKILNFAAGDDGEEVGGCAERFRRECSILAELENPGIVRYMGHGRVADFAAIDGTAQGRAYLMMELVEGLPIDVYCDRAGLEVDARTDLMIAVCRAVEVAHDRNVVHRDLKPTNILITAEGLPKLVDFGVAKLLEDTGVTRTGWATPLTPGYASPEQLLGEGATPASDVFALGVMLHEVLTGDSPFEAEARVDGPLGEIVAKSMGDEPARRYPSAGELGDDLVRCREGRRVLARGTRHADMLRRWSRRCRGVAASALASLVALAATVALLAQSGVFAAPSDQGTRKVSEMLVYVLDAATEIGDPAEVTSALAEVEKKFAGLSETPNGEARTRMAFGRAHAKLGQWSTAERHLRRAIDLIRNIDTFHPGSLPYCQRLLGRVLREQGRHAEANAVLSETR